MVVLKPHMTLASEAHLPPFRPMVTVRFLGPEKRRSWWSWAIFLGFIVLNETRGLYVVAQFLKAWTGN